MSSGAHGVRRGRLNHGAVQLCARVEGEGVHPHLIHLGLRLQTVRHNHWSSSGGGASRHWGHHRILGDALTWPARQGGHRGHPLEHWKV